MGVTVIDKDTAAKVLVAGRCVPMIAMNMIDYYCYTYPTHAVPMASSAFPCFFIIDNKRLFMDHNW